MKYIDNKTSLLEKKERSEQNRLLPQVQYKQRISNFQEEKKGSLKRKGDVITKKLANLVEQIFDLPFANVTREIADVDGSTVSPTHISCIQVRKKNLTKGSKKNQKSNQTTKKKSLISTKSKNKTRLFIHLYTNKHSKRSDEIIDGNLRTPPTHYRNFTRKTKTQTTREDGLEEAIALDREEKRTKEMRDSNLSLALEEMAPIGGSASRASGFRRRWGTDQGRKMVSLPRELFALRCESYIVAV